MAILGVNVNDLAIQDRVTSTVGSMSTDQLGTVLAQKAKTVASSNSLSIDEMTSRINAPNNLLTGGVGKYNLTPSALENAGFLKAGTVDRFLDDPGQISNVLNSSSVWTGKDAINSVNDVLGNSAVQTTMSTEIMGNSLADLKSSNIISGFESPNVVASITSVASDFGVGTTADWLGTVPGGSAAGNVLGEGLSAVNSLSLDTVARGAGFSVDFVDTKLTSMFTSGTGDLLGNVSGTLSGSLSEIAGSIGGISAVSDVAGNLIGGVSDALSSVLGGALGALGGALGGLLGGLGGLFGGGGGPTTVTPPAVTQTVKRDGIDTVVNSLIGNSKVAAPNYTGIVSATNFQLPSLSNLKDSFSGTTGSIEVCSCSDPTLIGPTKAECEDAGGTWTCKTVNNSNGLTLV